MMGWRALQAIGVVLAPQTAVETEYSKTADSDSGAQRHRKKGKYKTIELETTTETDQTTFSKCVR